MMLIPSRFSYLRAVDFMSRYTKIFLLFILLSFGAFSAQAQCPMCKTQVESSIKQGSNVGKGLNDGILYLMSIPYVLVGSIGVVWYRNHRRKKAAGE